MIDWTQMETSEDRIKKTIPRKITMRQCRLWLHRNKMLSNIDALLPGLPEDQEQEARIEWEYAADVERDTPLIMAVASGMGATEEEVDQWFLAASKI